MAAIFFVALFVVLILLLLFFFVFAEGKRRVPEEERVPPLVIPPRPPAPAPKVEAPSAADIYAPVTGTGDQKPPGPSKADLDEAFSAISMAQEPVPEPVETPRPPSKREKPRVRPKMDIGSVLPQKALPKKMREETWDDEGSAEFEDWEE
jgi:hypothetical protein